MRAILIFATLFSTFFSANFASADALESVIMSQEQATVVILDGGKIRSQSDLYDKFQIALGLDVSFGRNLDALYDVLTDRSEKLIIVIQNQKQLKTNISNEYYNNFIETLLDASLVNSNIKINRRR